MWADAFERWRKRQWRLDKMLCACWKRRSPARVRSREGIRATRRDVEAAEHATWDSKAHRPEKVADKNKARERPTQRKERKKKKRQNVQL